MVTLSSNTIRNDAVGNRTKQVSGAQTTTYVYDNNDRLTSETTGASTTNYTFTGTQLTKKVASGVTTNYTYNLQGRLATVGTTSYEYDANGNRVSEKIGAATRTDYLIDALNLTGYAQVFTEKQSTTLKNFYAIGHDIVSQYNSTNGVLYFLKDGLSNTRAMLSSTGTVSERYDFDAFGNAVGFTPASAKTKLLYCNESFDVTSGWYYLRARYYDPKVGRFNRLDPFFGNISDPQSLHKYTYCHGDPVNCCDPTGLMTLLGVSVRIGITTMLAGISISAMNSIVGYSYGQMNAYDAFASFGKGVIGSTLCGLTTGIGWFTFGGLSLGASLTLITGLSATSIYALLKNGGADRILTGINQRLFSQAKHYLTMLQPEIIRASVAYKIPAEIVANALVAEMLDYNMKDYFWDDSVLSTEGTYLSFGGRINIEGPEKHSIGIAQIRIDTARKWNLNGWDAATPASTIRASLNHPQMAVALLAELLSKINQREANPILFDKWLELSDRERKAVTMLFLGAKDDDRLSGDGQLTGLIDGSFEMVRESKLFPPYNKLL